MSSSQQWVSDAEVAEIPFTAFASAASKHAVTARLIVRRVRDANPTTSGTRRASCSRSGAYEHLVISATMRSPSLWLGVLADRGLVCVFGRSRAA